MGNPQHPWRIPLLVLGWALIVLTPFVGILPGPGGVFVFAGGLILLLRNSCWVRRQYALGKRRWPKLGDYADRVLRRPSARRRRELRESRACSD